MPGDKPARSAQELADKWQKEAGAIGRKGPEKAGPQVTPAAAGGGSSQDLGREREGVDNSEQRQLDRERAAIGRQDRPGLPDKPDAGGGAKLEKGTSLSSNNNNNRSNG
jgi:hypothetical protein